MTIEDIERMDCNLLTVKQVSQFLECDPQLIRDQADAEPKYLGFPISKICHAYKIPRAGFIAWAKGNIPVIVIKSGGDVS